jgi:hypothetical protein
MHGWFAVLKWLPCHLLLSQFALSSSMSNGRLPEDLFPVMLFPVAPTPRSKPFSARRYALEWLDVLRVDYLTVSDIPIFPVSQQKTWRSYLHELSATYRFIHRYVHIYLCNAWFLRIPIVVDCCFYWAVSRSLKFCPETIPVKFFCGNSGRSRMLGGAWER